MKTWHWAFTAAWLSLAAAALTTSASAQGLGSTPLAPSPEVSLSSMQMTPEMWYYQQEYRRENDPRELRKARARYHAAQREQRIASQKWYGLSPLRPVASPTPFLGSYSPRWVGNSIDPHYWRSGTSTYLAIVPSYAR